MQRFIPQFVSGYNDAKDLNFEYNYFIEKYIKLRCKIILSDKESLWLYFENLYKVNNENKTIDLNNFELAQTEFDRVPFSEIQSNSLQIRDSVILRNIYNSFQYNENVLIVFGARHLLAQKPTLDKIFN